MKTKIFIGLLVVAMTTACGTKKNNLSAAYEVATEAETTTKEVVAEEKTQASEALMDSKARITETKDRYQMENGQFVEKPFHIIVGSFKNENNAKNLRSNLAKTGMKAFVAVNKDGMYRVFAVSSDDETSIRTELVKVRQSFPDAWILKLTK